MLSIVRLQRWLTFIMAGMVFMSHFNVQLNNPSAEMNQQFGEN